MKKTEKYVVDPGHSIERNILMWENHRWVEGEWSPSKEWEADLIGWFVDNYVGEMGTVLEIGVGSGKWTWYLLKKFEKVIGVDITEAAMRMCREKFAGERNLSLFKNNGSTVPFVKDNSVDLVWSYDVFVHISPHDVASYFAEFARVMKKGAVGIVHHGAVGEKAGWRSTLTDAMVDRFILDNPSLVLVEHAKKWGVRGKYEPIYKDSLTVFRKG